MAAKKTEVKAKTETVVKPAVEALNKAAETVVETVKETAATPKKTTAKKAPARRTTTRKTTTRKSTRKAAVKESVILQFSGKEIDTASILEQAKKAWTDESGKDADAIKEVKIYVKPEESAAYYVINEELKGSIAL